MSFPSPLYRWRPHPWHGLETGPDAPCIVLAFHRLRHYFATYKTMPGEPVQVSIESVYNAEHARKVVQAAMDDYREVFGS